MPGGIHKAHDLKGNDHACTVCGRTDTASHRKITALALRPHTSVRGASIQSLDQASGV